MNDEKKELEKMIFTDISNLVYPIARIVDGRFSLLGSAFFCEKQGYLISAAHVIAGNEKQLAVVMNELPSIQDFQDTSIDNRKCIPLEVVAFNPIHDICILKSDLPICSKIVTSSLDFVKVGEEVVLFGYPHCNFNRMVLTQQNAHVGAKVLIERSGIKMKNIVLNIQARPGQSGSPIIHNNELVGMLIGPYVPNGGSGISLGGIDPQTLHQTTHAVSAEYIKEMM